MNNLPTGNRELKTAVVYLDDQGRLTVTAEPDEIWPGIEDMDEDTGHDCDAMGCGWEHVVHRTKIGTIEGAKGTGETIPEHQPTPAEMASELPKGARR